MLLDLWTLTSKYGTYAAKAAFILIRDILVASILSNSVLMGGGLYLAVKIIL